MCWELKPGPYKSSKHCIHLSRHTNLAMLKKIPYQVLLKVSPVKLGTKCQDDVGPKFCSQDWAESIAISADSFCFEACGFLTEKDNVRTLCKLIG